MLREDMDLDVIRLIILERDKLAMTKCDVVQNIFEWDVTWAVMEPIFQAFWEAVPEALDIYERKHTDEGVSPEDEEREEELMNQWGLDARGEVALSMFTRLINWKTGEVFIPTC